MCTTSEFQTGKRLHSEPPDFKDKTQFGAPIFFIADVLHALNGGISPDEEATKDSRLLKGSENKRARRGVNSVLNMAQR